MRTILLCSVIAGVAAAAPVAPFTFAELSRAGEWPRILEVARLRAAQLPLRPDEALVAAAAARHAADRTAEQGFLEAAVSGGPAPEVAAVELAERLVESDPTAAVGHALPVLVEPPTTALGDAAGRVVERAVGAKLPAADRERVATLLPRVRRSRSRPIEVALGVAENDPARLARVVLADTRDLAALDAATVLDRRDDLSPELRWRIAEAFYSHASYREAAARLERLAATDHRAVPADRVAFLRGRCAFRVGRWDDAAAWYRRALARTRDGEGRAELLVHLARTLELDGDLEGAVEAARAAVLARASDDRRLFLARLRLRRGETDLALLGISRIRSRTARDRGQLMVALDELRRGAAGAAAGRLDEVRRAPWAAPAAVLGARAALDAGRDREALARLVARSRVLDGYWGDRARALMSQLPPATVEQWRQALAGDLAGGDPRRRRRAVAEWSVLEPDRDRLPGVRASAAAVTELALPVDVVLPDSLAARLWSLGLERSAVRWDGASLPTDTAGRTLWSALAMLEHGAPWDAIRLADRAWRLAGADIALRGHPAELRRAMLPLPERAALRSAAAAAGAPWELVAAVAREESRWDPGALSAVGARGLMQLMPATAEIVAARLARDPARLDLFDPATALELGASELARLLAVFDGRRAAAVAAYNAGEDQARQWLDQCGPDCTEERYVAQISFTATRIYTADVLWSAAGYLELDGRGGSGSVDSSRAASSDAAAAAPARPSASS